MRLSVVIAIGLALACGGRSDPATEPDAPISIHLENRNWSAVDVYVLTDGIVAQVAMLESQESADRRLQGAVGAGRVRVLIDPIGSRLSYLTDWISIQPGQRIDLIIANELQFTTWTVAFRR